MHQYKLFATKANKVIHLNKCLYCSTINYSVLIIRVIKERFISTVFKDTGLNIFIQRGLKTKQSQLLKWINFTSKILFQETFHSLPLLCYITFYFYSLLELISRDHRWTKHRMEVTSEMKVWFKDGMRRHFDYMQIRMFALVMIHLQMFKYHVRITDKGKFFSIR